MALELEALSPLFGARVSGVDLSLPIDDTLFGELERAFDCFQILLKLGKESAQFENLAEGYVNCIRVLRASARMDLLPSARGPNSIRPCSTPTTFSLASAAAT